MLRDYTIVIEWTGVDDELRTYGDGTEITVRARGRAAAIRQARLIFANGDGRDWGLTIIDAMDVFTAREMLHD